MVTVPVSEDSGAQVVWLSEAKSYLNFVTDGKDDDLVATLDAAISWAGDYLRRPVRRESFRKSLHTWEWIDGRAGIRLPGYVSAVTTVAYQTAAGVFTTISSSVYSVLIGQHSTTIREAPNQSWPALGEYQDNIRVTYSAGWLHSDCPYGVRLGVLMKMRHLIDLDDASENAARNLLNPWRLPW